MAAAQPDSEREPELISGRDALGAKLAEVIVAAQGELALLSLSLNRRLYCRSDVLDALKQFALRSPRAHMRILVADARAATNGGNNFLELVRKLPSRVQLRELTPEKRETDGAERLIADRRCMLDLPSQDRLEATYYAQPAPQVLERIKDFDALWDESEPALELSGMQM